MLPNDLSWRFPTSLEEAEDLLKIPGFYLHGGGTRILKTQPKSIAGLIDISGLELDYIHLNNGIFSIGATATFSDIVEYSRRHKKLLLLGKALSQAAATPLRNRITIGGSLKDFPIWSSLYAPLIAQNAKIEIIVNGNNFVLPVEEYVISDIHKGKHIITRLMIEDKHNALEDVKRFSLLKFEYPLFTVAATLETKKDEIEDARIVITGVKTRFKRFKSAENVLIGKQLSPELAEKAEKHFNPKFVSDYKYSAGYKENTARVFLIDLLDGLCGGKK